MRDFHTAGPSLRPINGVSFHPLQRQGLVGVDSHLLTPRLSIAGSRNIDDAPPAAQQAMTLPPVIAFIGSPRDPRFMV